MIRRLTNLAALLSLLLCVATSAMWVRSLEVTEAWHFAATRAADRLEHRAMESANGRLAYVEYDLQGMLPGSPPPNGGYSRSLVPLSPTRHGWAFSATTPATVHGRIPGLAEWWDSPRVYSAKVGRTSWRQRLIFIPWRTFTFAFAVFPVVWAWRRWQGRLRGPAFPVLPASTESAPL